MRMMMVTMLVALSLVGVTAAWSEDYLYSPQKVSEGAASGDGVLVREITVKKGDTLSHLSKKYAGRGHYYPQILLFNKIKNPHRIHRGQLLRVPLYAAPVQDNDAVTQRSALTDKAEADMQVLEKPAVAVESLPAQQPVAKKRTAKVQKKIGRNERKAYDQANQVYQQGNCVKAITLFDRFLKRYPASTFVSDITLNRAECYLKLSSESSRQP